MIAYVFNGLVFVLLGLQLRHMLAAVGQLRRRAGWRCLAVSLWALLMALRLGWVWASAHARFRLQWGWAGAAHRARTGGGCSWSAGPPCAAPSRWRLRYRCRW